MQKFAVVWVDMRLREGAPVLARQVAHASHLVFAECAEELERKVHATKADIITFDFDYPHARGLRMLLSCRKQLAHVPVLMLVEQCYDELLLWALRARVWDVLIKPVEAGHVTQRMEWIRAARNAASREGIRANAMPEPVIPVQARFSTSGTRGHCTDSACGYIQDHIHEKLSEGALARRCGMSRFQFSRSFRDEHGMTFRDYVLWVRLNRAEAMLSHTDAPITEVAFCSGFHDLSHFASLFRRRTGCSPRQFRQRQRSPG
jgi:AraC-like DNA-binding protein/CheY-like chemotaxis protein